MINERCREERHRRVLPRSLHQSSKEWTISKQDYKRIYIFPILFLVTIRYKVKRVITTRRTSSRTHTTTQHLTFQISWHNPTILHRTMCYTHPYFLTSPTLTHHWASSTCLHIPFVHTPFKHMSRGSGITHGTFVRNIMSIPSISSLLCNFSHRDDYLQSGRPDGPSIITLTQKPSNLKHINTPM